MDDLNKKDSNSAITNTEEKDNKDKQHKEHNTSSHDKDYTIPVWLMMNSATE